VVDFIDPHTAVLDLLGAWALDACADDEAAVVAAHLETCRECAAEAHRLRSAASWLALDQPTAAPRELRHRTLHAAWARRAPTLLRTLTTAYAGQVALLDHVLAGLEVGDWRRPDPRHDDLAGVIAHLSGNDAMLATDLGLPGVGSTGSQPDATWRAQTRVLVDGLATEVDIDRPVRLAGPGPTRMRALRDVLVQRAFETWIHRDDLSLALGRSPVDPPPEQARRIVDLAVALLPEALRAHDVIRPNRCARLDLRGAGGGEWTVPIGHSGPVEGVDVTITADAVAFCRLVANRVAPPTLLDSTAGDRGLAAELLRVAATLGCD
jgi:uncharacterized protein (TIGR03083 family)